MMTDTTEHNQDMAPDQLVVPAQAGQADVARPDELGAVLSGSIRQGMAVLDSARRLVSFNEMFSVIAGGCDPGTELSAAFAPDGLDDLFASVARTGKAVRDAELTLAIDEETEAHYVVSITPLGDDNAFTVLLVDDVTDRVQQHERMVANSRLVSVGEMAAGVAHELNNPLTAILGFSQLALRQQVDEVLRRDLEAIAVEAERAGRIVDNLLSFARNYASESNVLDAAASVQKILDLREYECRVNNIEVVTYFEPDTPRTKADVHRLEQVFLNLLGNSIQAIAEGPGRGTITVGLVAIDDRIRISFTDDGPGIPPEILPRIFEPYFTTKPVGKGTGLGLSICRQIAQEHGGDIRVESHPRRGTTFVVEIPIVPVKEPQFEEKPAPEAAPQNYTMLRVLAVDDETSVTDLLARALGGFGHDVDVSRDGAEALRMIHLADYDAILLDIKMPGLGGPEVYRCIEGLRPDLLDRVLFITGDTVSPDTKLFIQSTGVEVLHKPFSLDELRRRMDRLAAAKNRRLGARDVGGRPDLAAGLTQLSKR